MKFRLAFFTRTFYALIFILFNNSILAQNTVIKDSTVTIDSTKLKNNRPRNAALLSTFIPGSGQIYNQKYWKTPLIYAGFSGLGFMIYRNNSEYQDYRNIYRTLIDTISGNEIESPYSAEQLKVLKDGARRNRDFFIIIAVAWYAANIIDAIVDAHLYDFDVSDNLSFRVSPFLNYNTNIAMGRQGIQSGLTLNFRLKK
jgi:hypothetical protein